MSAASRALDVDGGDVEAGLGELGLEVRQGAPDEVSHGDVAVPLAVGRDDVPGGVLGRSAGNGVLVGLDVAGPQVAVLDILGHEFPLLAGVVLALEQALSLLFVADVEENFDNGNAFVGQHAFKVIDVVEAFFPDFGRLEVSDADGEHVFVLAAVEDDDFAQRGDGLVDAPEVVVAQLQRGRFAEGGDMDALRVEPAEDMADGAVLAGGVHALQDDEQAVLFLGVEFNLQVV